jgi:hypothetical protein
LALRTGEEEVTRLVPFSAKAAAMDLSARLSRLTVLSSLALALAVVVAVDPQRVNQVISKIILISYFQNYKNFVFVITLIKGQAFPI